jgi:hypothetical protein
VIELSDDWRPDRSGVIVRPDGVDEGIITLYVVRRSDFLASQELFSVVASWLAEGIRLALSIPGPVGTFPVRAVVTDYLKQAITAGDRGLFDRLVERSLDSLAGHDWQPDGVVACYAVGEA